MRGVDQYLRVKLLEATKYYPDWEFLAIGMHLDHLHLHMVIPPKYPVGQIVGTLKRNTSRHLREKFPFLDKVYWDREGIWSKGYFVSTAGVDGATIRKYVEMQGREDAGQAQLVLL